MKCPTCGYSMIFNREIRDINELPMIVAYWKCQGVFCDVASLAEQKKKQDELIDFPEPPTIELPDMWGL